MRASANSWSPDVVGLRTLMLVGCLSGLALFGVGQARADCLPAGGTSFVCSGPTTLPQFILLDDAVVVTTAGFDVDTTLAGGPAVAIAGNGSLSYVDDNASALLSDDVSLMVDNLGGGAGEVLVVSNGAITSTNAAGAAVLVGNAGAGDTTVTLSGPVTGVGGGIIIGNSNVASTGAVTLTTGNVDAGNIGIGAIQAGAGALQVTAGTVTAVDIGILALVSPFNVDGVVVDAHSVTAGTGISVTNLGAGATSVTVTGTATGTTNVGVVADVLDVANTGGVTLDIANATGDFAGIAVANDGVGVTSVTTTSMVTSTSGAGIAVLASNNANANDVVVDANSVTGDGLGILVGNDGIGTTRIMVGGVVEGETAIAIDSLNDASAEITINGEVRSTLGVTGVAIDTSFNGATDVTNNSVLTGRLELGDLDDIVTNAGLWDVAGTSRFGLGLDELDNQVGAVLRAARLAAVAETTLLRNLETYSGGGTLSLADGGAGDSLEFEGDVVFSLGAVQDIDLGAAADIVLAGGTADLTEATLRVRLQSDYVLGQTFAVLTAGGGVTGQYGALDGGTAYLGLVDTYDANNAYLQVVLRQALAAPGRTPNQIATGHGLESLALSNPLVVALLAAMTDDEARAMLDSVSGEIHGSVQSALLRESRLVREAVLAHLRASLDGASSAPVLAYAADSQALSWSPELTQIWSEAVGSWGRVASDGNASEMHTRTGALLVGADSMIGDWRVGLLLGYGSTHMDVANLASSADSSTYQVGLYGGTAWGDVAFRTGMAYAWNDISSTRTAVSGGVAQVLTADYGTSAAQAFGELAYMMDFGSSTLEPFANAAVVGTQNAAFTEQGGSAALSTAASTNVAAFTTLGLRAAAKFIAGETALVTVSGAAGWRQGWGNAPQVQNSFAGGTGFSIAGAAVSGGALVLDAAVDVDFSDQLRVSTTYNSVIGQAQFDQSIKGALAVRF
jgi:outer membrane autotransporter protein